MKTVRLDASSLDKEEIILHGIAVSPGIAIGRAFVVDQHNAPVPEYKVHPAKLAEEIKRFQAAINKTQKQLGRLKHKAQFLPESAREAFLQLLDAYKAMLSSSRLVHGVEEFIKREKINAEAAIQKQAAEIEKSFKAMEDPYLASRIDDVHAVCSRIIKNLLEQKLNPFANAPEGSILIAEDFTPADTAVMEVGRIAGYASVFGGKDGHAAIMARALGLPAVLGVTEITHLAKTDDQIIVNGGSGEVIINPSPATLHRYRLESARQNREKQRLKTLRDLPAVTADGVNITLLANLELPREIDNALEHGAKGIGLLRTEFMFMNRPDLPDEEEQFEFLRKLLQKTRGAPLVIRTLDVGGEKLASSLTDIVGESSNPALGLRAIRLGLREPKILDTQLTAILRAAAYGDVRILIPMISSVSQIIKVKEHIEQIERKLRRRGEKLPAKTPPLGVMIEVPGTALAADAFAKVCDFFSIGSNDLTQYTLAIDRGDERVADLYNPFHPGVLRLIQLSIISAWRANIPVCLCGELAGDPKATALLLGLGLREFSMAPSRLPLIKQVIRSISMSQAVAFAERIMAKTNETEVMNLINSGIESVAKKRVV